MKLHTDPTAAVHDSAAATATLIGSLIPAMSRAVDQMTEALVLHMLDDPDAISHAQAFARDVYIASTAPNSCTVNPLAHLLCGITPPRTKGEFNVISFVRTLPGVYITDLRTGKVGNMAPFTATAAAESFVPELYPLANRLLDILVRDIIDTSADGKVAADGSPDWNVTSLTLAASGVLEEIMRKVADEGDPELIDFPDGLLIPMYLHDIIPSIPDVGVYARYRQAHSDELTNPEK